MTTLADRLMSGGAGLRGSVMRVSPATAHAAGCALAFTAAVAGGIHLMDAADWSGLARSRVLLATAQARAAAAQRMLADAVHVRDTGDASVSDADARSVPTWPALVLEVAALTGASGLRIASIEPRSVDGAGADGRRTMRIVADGGFPAARRLMDRLASFRVLAVPVALHIERKALEARIDMTLDVFPTLPALSDAEGAAAPAFASAPAGDPFDGAGAPVVSDGPALRLAGTINGARAALALFDSGDGTFTAIAPGEALGAARLTRVDAGAVMLATADGAHRVVMDDGGGR
ncbi:pilus assembly protein [Burkholderia sp. AU19243]|uniref:pilus assembly protein n=1 Tax=Burkholderia sp. AU19243 TaxID=2824810 RepID=UPI001B9B7D07|nr:pilus assembly protein [Burkholderia sp. AU19243]MBR8145192.1 pilus assembly protein [Burkholderia vietnamiensis]MBR8366221.1 pilus assembly protein [Burkholderia sp. AU19243]